MAGFVTPPSPASALLSLLKIYGTSVNLRVFVLAYSAAGGSEV